MSELALKYRPQNFDEFFGNDETIESLKSVLDREIEDIPHCMLFEGPSGCGKTTLSKIVANKIGAVNKDIKEYNISDMRGIDTAREIIKNTKFSAMYGSYKVYILNEVHKATNEFQNAMLDILEAPPVHCFFILCTTEPEKLLSTIRGQRAMIFPVSSLRKQIVVKLLNWILKEEDVKFPEKHILEIANVCDGSPRKAISLLDKIIDTKNDEKAFKIIVDSTVSEKKVIDICRLLVDRNEKNKTNKFKKISKMVKELDTEPENARYAIKGYLGAVLSNNADPHINNMLQFFLSPFHYSGKEGLLSALFYACHV